MTDRTPQNTATSPAASSPRASQSAAIIDFGGEELHLLADRALWWPSERALFVADLHIGKEATFRAAGFPVPDVFSRDLARLGNIVARLEPQQLFILGDLLHDRPAHAPEVVRSVAAWRHGIRHVGVTLVRGNHDRRAGDPPADWEIDCVGEPACHGQLQLRHLPLSNDERPTLAGHLHPKYRLRHGPDELRLPCFLQRRNTLILPAFAAFIDHATIVPEPNDAIFLVADSEVIPIGSQSNPPSSIETREQ